MKPEARERFERLADIQSRIGQLKLAEEELVAEIVEAHGIGELSTKVGGRIPVVEQPMKFSAKKAAEVLAVAPALLALVKVDSWTIPAAKCKELLPPAVLEQCYVTNGKPKIKFKEVSE